MGIVEARGRVMITFPTITSRNGTNGHNSHRKSYGSLRKEFDRERQLLISEWVGLLNDYREGLDSVSYQAREEDIWNRYNSLRNIYRELGLNV